MTAAEIAEILGIALSTVSLWLRRIGLGKRSRLQPPEPPNRYERSGRRADPRRRQEARALPGRRQAGPHHPLPQPGRRLGVLPRGDRRRHPARLRRGSAQTSAAPLRLASFAARSPGSPSTAISVERVMTDNGSPYISTIHAATCRELGLRHLRTRPYRPQTNGKAERFIQTMLREWAYGRLFSSSAERRESLPSGSTTTTTADDTAPSATDRPLARRAPGTTVLRSYS